MSMNVPASDLGDEKEPKWKNPIVYFCQGESQRVTESKSELVEVVVKEKKKKEETDGSSTIRKSIKAEKTQPTRSWSPFCKSRDKKARRLQYRCPQ